MTKNEALTLALEALKNNKQTHYYCEDTWYSCPQHADGCANDAAGDECNCGTAEANIEIDKAITAIRETLAQPEQDDRRLQIAMRQWEDWKIYALELQKKLVKYEGGSPMMLNTQPEQKPINWVDHEPT